MKKRILAALLATAMATLLLTACGEGGSAPDEATLEATMDKDGIAQPETIISAVELYKLMEENDDVVVIGSLSSAKALVPGSIESKPISGSYTVWRDDYSGSNADEATSAEVSGFRYTQAEMETLLSKAGATPESTIVVYSAENMHDGARLYFQIGLLGHEDVRYLDGGLDAWVAADLPYGDAKKLVDEEQKTAYVAPNYEAGEWDVTPEQIVAALENPEEWVVIDTRTTDEYEGLEHGSSAGAFGTGRIKDAIHIEWKQAVNSETNELKSIEELEAIYGDVVEGKKVITFCQSGVRSAHTQYVLRDILGVDEVYNYDGSWIEWSYINSEASNGDVSDDLKAIVSEHTELFADNGKPI